MTRVLILLLVFGLSINHSFAQGEQNSKESTKTHKKNKKKKKEALNAEIDALVDEELQFKIPVITGRQLKELNDTKEPLIVLDARNKKDYDSKHIKDSKWIGSEDFSIEKVWMLDQNKIVVVYGSMGSQIEEIGKKLQEVGFKTLYNLHGDLDEWAKHEYVILAQ
ncbi:MAG: rhodanese-like domain-containing protein [Aureispira sp.]|nr:rhodanese-like domain-containing protein [Aureispira sp.]